jgi:predicted nuclease of restriction endonuclease-like RecB superfamily
MPYSYPDNVPTFAKNKTADLQKRVISLFNETLARTYSEEQARRAALAFMQNYEAKYGDATDKRIKKSLEDLTHNEKVVELVKSLLGK